MRGIFVGCCASAGKLRAKSRPARAKPKTLLPIFPLTPSAHGWRITSSAGDRSECSLSSDPRGLLPLARAAELTG